MGRVCSRKDRPGAARHDDSGLMDAVRPPEVAPSNAEGRTKMDAEPLQLTHAQEEYLADTMKKVSRSFALVVPSLEKPLDNCVATAYLMCRVVDNIEDCAQSFGWKQHRFDEFHQLVAEPASASEILAIWGQDSWPGLTQDERAMMGQDSGLSLWQIYARLADGNRASIRHWVSEMADGMLRIEDPEQHPRFEERRGVRMLADEPGYNEYCYYVAGTVGHMATELVVMHYGLGREVSAKLVATCEACGRALQKTNIVKDFAEDLERGVSYLPYAWHHEADFSPLSLAGAPAWWKKRVIDDVLQELRTSTEYVLALPYSAAGYRMASLLCLLPAYQTMLAAARQQDTLFTTRHHVKMSRPAMAKCQWDAHQMLADNSAVLQYGRRLEAQIRALMS
jgi:farnesyl-diphosphate farnesyltransferase